MRPLRWSIYCLLSAFIAFSQASAWGPSGHHTVGAIADGMIAGTRAAAEVQAILGGISLRDASVWADCAKGVDPGKNYSYETEGKYPECKIYETPGLEAEMSDFVRRNDTNCSPKPGAASCHTEYHYTDVAIQHDHYDRSFVGTRDDDVVGAIVAATHVLKGEPAPAPFSFKDRREALLLLAHYVGDLHQPLHVGAAYLDPKGRLVDPDKGTYDPNTDTRGGNDISVGSTNLHALWDAIPASLAESHVNALLKQAESVQATSGNVYDWPAIWASDTLGAARRAFSGIKFSGKKNGQWNATLPSKYRRRMNSIKKTQVTKAGAHLGQLLEAVWP